MDFGPSSRVHRIVPPLPEGNGDPHEVLRPYSSTGSEVHVTRASSPVRSAYRVSDPLDGLLPRLPSGPAEPEPLVGFTLQSISMQSRTPLGADPFLPFEHRVLQL